MIIRFYTFIITVIALPCYANNLDIEKEVLKQANNEIKVATERYDAIFTNCKEKANRNIDVSLFKEIKLSLDDLSNALLYLSIDAQERCERTELQDYFFTLSKVKTIYEHYGKTPPNEVHLLNAVHYSTWRDFELRVRFKTIPLKYRLPLKKMEELKQPFMPLKLYHDIEKEYYKK